MPLPGQALAILRDAQSLRDRTGLVFPSPRGKPFSDMALSKLIKELGFPRGAAWVPVKLQGLGGGADEYAS